MYTYARSEDSLELDHIKELECDSPEDELLMGSRPRCRKPLISWFQSHTWSIVGHLMLLSLNLILVSVYGQARFANKHVTDSLYSSNPLRNFIEYEERKFSIRPIYKGNGEVDDHQATAFNGPPRPELEDEWARLMKYENVRVTKDELGEFAENANIANLTDGSGYYVTVSAFHGLHCVRNLHKYIYADHYYQGYSEHHLWTLRRHTEHCLDWLRQFIQCNADPTLIPISWFKESAVPQATDSGHHYCVNWQRFEEWMMKHSFNPQKPGLLVHPQFGEAYRNDTGVKLGLGVEELSER